MKNKNILVGILSFALSLSSVFLTLENVKRNNVVKAGYKSMDKYEINFLQEKIDLNIGDRINLYEYIKYSAFDGLIEFISEENIVLINGHTLEALKEGSCTITARYMDKPDNYSNLTVNIQNDLIFVENHLYGTLKYTGSWSKSKDQPEGFGKLVYPAGQFYEGNFKNGLFDDNHGKYDWSTRDSDGKVISYGWLYEGKFVKGSNSGKIGKLTFTSGRTPEKEFSGVYWAECLIKSVSYSGNFACTEIVNDFSGHAEIHYADKTFYIGEVYRNSNGGYSRRGEGIHYFYDSPNYTAEKIGGSNNDLIYCFKGTFQEGVTGKQWIDGNGVYYICANDSNLTPLHYIRGQWYIYNRIGAWHTGLSKWDDSMLLEEYRDCDEIDYVDGYLVALRRLLKEYNKESLSNKTLLVGSSTYTDWPDPLYKNQLAPEFDALNLGQGGSTLRFWNSCVNDNETWKTISLNQPKTIFINCYGNDIAEGKTVEETYNNAIGFLEGLRRHLPTTEIIFCSVNETPARWEQRHDNHSLFKKVSTWISQNNDDMMYAFDCTSFCYYSDGTTSSYYDPEWGYLRIDIWKDDKLHLTDYGHSLLAQRMKELYKTIVK